MANLAEVLGMKGLVLVCNDCGSIDILISNEELIQYDSYDLVELECNDCESTDIIAEER